MSNVIKPSLSRSLVRATLVDAREVANANARCREALDYIQAELGVSERTARELWNNYADWRLVESLRVKDNAMWQAAASGQLKARRYRGATKVVIMSGMTCPAFSY